MRKGYYPKYVMSLDMPTGRRTGPWKASVAGKVALELALDGSLAVFPNDEDGRDSLELIVHVLSNEGFQIHGEMQRRPPMTEEEKVAKRANRMVLYVVHPAEMMNLRSSAYESRLASFKSTATAHFLGKGAENVGFCQARDNEGNNMNRTVMFVVSSTRSATSCLRTSPLARLRALSTSTCGAPYRPKSSSISAIPSASGTAASR